MKETETEVEVLDMDIVEVEEGFDKNSEMIAQKELTVSELLKKNNELLEYHNNIITENKKIMNLNGVVNILFKLILIVAAAVFCFFLYKIYNEIVLNNQKETTIVNNLPAQETPVFNVNVPESKVAVNNQTVLDKVSFYKGGFYGHVYKNTSQNMVYCRLNDFEEVYDVVIAPNSVVELTPRIFSCKDAELIEIRDPSTPKIKNKPYFEL